jgi:putative MATE family efflux protein
MFTRKQLIKLIIPLMIEQVLAVTVGMADMVMVANAGETAVSGVSIVDALNLLLISLFSALATGGAVVSAQYLGHKDLGKACKSANQLLLSSFVISFTIMIIALFGNNLILKLIYGHIDAEVFSNARKYFYITAVSFPFLAIYNSCAALFRAMGNSRVSMKVSVIMNVINVVGNAILVFGFHMGVVGVAIPTLVSRAVAAIIMLNLIRNKEHPVHIDSILHLGYDWSMIKRILNIGIPNGLENSIFQIGKVLVQGLIASFGTAAITANAVASTIASFENIPGSAIGLAMITIVGQCVGANDHKQAKKYTIKLMKLTHLTVFIVSLTIVLFREPIISIYQISPATASIALQLIIYHSICSVIIWPPSFALPNALRAANDVKFTMYVAIASMWIWRIVLSYILAKTFGLGVLGVWIAMTVDWLFRAICFLARFISGKWKLHAYIG